MGPSPLNPWPPAQGLPGACEGAARQARPFFLRVESGSFLALSGVLVLLAVLIAPEQPRFQEAICQRHNGVAACRVW